MDDGSIASITISTENGITPEMMDEGRGENGHKRSPSGGILSKLSILRASAEENQIQADNGPPSPEPEPGIQPTSPNKTSRAMAVAVQQVKTRRRKGSLRKAALLGRGAQRDKKELEASPLITNAFGTDGSHRSLSPEDVHPVEGLGFGSLETLTFSSRDGYTSSSSGNSFPPPPILVPTPAEAISGGSTLKTSPTLSYTSTTDEDDVLSFPKHHSAAQINDLPLSSGSEPYFGESGSLFRRRSTQKPKSSPLSFGGLAASSLPTVDDDWDYSETEWWGWVVLIVTWVVFVVGMGSCLDVWSWAWDVGETPYAPPELEDDPTLPIVGYYPALMILTGVMAWVWVVVAWVGMKYFRHAKISGD
jgi:hypothetical protein